MRKIFVIAATVCTLFSFSMSAQQNNSVPLAVVIDETTADISENARELLSSRLDVAVTKNGMGATGNFSQFYLTCSYILVNQSIVPGAPTKYSQQAELNIDIVDAFADKVFASTMIDLKGIGNSAEQANMAVINQLSPVNSKLVAFLKESNTKIVNYYNSQYKTIIQKAEALAKVYNYEEALFQLSLVPEACSGYQTVVDVATGIYQKYLDDKANKALAKATAIWNSGQDAAAAAEAGLFIAEIDPNATCYPAAVALSNEIKNRVKSDIDYYRKRDEIHEERDYNATIKNIEAWKSVGVAYGNNQKSVYYKALY